MTGPARIVPPSDANLNTISQEFSHEELLDATEGFSSSSRLGHGTYGSVFRGTLRDGTEVAIKALQKPNEAGFREEVEVLSKFRHPNLVILLGFARSDRERYLVYELLPGGDLCARLQSKDATFTWRPRTSVVLDAALGLSHLHGSRPQVFHRDIKTQNILMDRNGTGKMADFGLALLAQHCDSLTVEHTSGTIGYADPLYIRTGVVTARSEVYSFGMVLLEVLTGRPPALQHSSGRIEYQFRHVNGELSRVRAMVDRRIPWPPAVVERVGTLALRCSQEAEAGRPTFVEVVRELRQLMREVPEQHDAPPAPASAGSLTLRLPAHSRDSVRSGAGALPAHSRDSVLSGAGGGSPIAGAGFSGSPSSATASPKRFLGRRAPGDSPVKGFGSPLRSNGQSNHLLTASGGFGQSPGSSPSNRCFDS